jgi:hypothetical protein
MTDKSVQDYYGLNSATDLHGGTRIKALKITKILKALRITMGYFYNTERTEGTEVKK